MSRLAELAADPHAQARLADDVVFEAVRLYVQGLQSYRSLAVLLEQRVGRSVGRATLNDWVYELGGQAKTPLEVSAEHGPRWGGFLGIDSKAIRVKGQRHCLLIGVDQQTQDVVHALVLPVETTDEVARLETETRLDAGYPLHGVVCDSARDSSRYTMTISERSPFRPVGCTSIAAWTAMSPRRRGRPRRISTRS